MCVCETGLHSTVRFSRYFESFKKRVYLFFKDNNASVVPLVLRMSTIVADHFVFRCWFTPNI
ncbi:hypothetical protein RR46_07941 [Papilio xuthus]|uniref:Uncharacterized protein n=1 Tax=Papilio xuthus TaxID=66420 RepID=A0A194QFC3_PAPXU|nr:hypothetical protein RR46_07941 [Papilio xuthus]